ncbi:Neutral/alkaline non-lysosomal ceramidase-domain-containing protein [Mycena olivaceomarginata]|nr:Neutral/alkaline non-lysosomal ceramidase-domain-containing protein [Mycena olivaceomarginata]
MEGFPPKTDYNVIRTSHTIGRSEDTTYVWLISMAKFTQLTFRLSEFELNFGDFRPSLAIDVHTPLRSSPSPDSFLIVHHNPDAHPAPLFALPLPLGRSPLALEPLRLLYALFASTPFVSRGEYLLGLRIADITGPVVETNMMGYASLAQTATGLHMRRRARAFIVAERASPTDRILFISADIAMGDSGVRRALLAALAEEYGEGTYHAGNVALGVGGYLENLLPQITSRGLHPQTLSAILSGTLLATRRAHASLAPGSLALATGRVENGSINRSPTAYRANPAAERARYSDTGGEDGDQEWERRERADGAQNNTLISGDNKGMAAYLYESSIEPHAMPGNTTYVAGFVQGAVGDTSPNTLGAFCESPGQPYDGLPCVANSSTCGARAQECHGRGPLFDKDLAGSGELGGWGFESSTEVGRRQVAGVRGAMGLSDSDSASSDSGLQQGPTAKTELKAKAKRQGGKGGMQPVHGPVRSAHAYVDMGGYGFALANGTRVMTCPAAMGACGSSPTPSYSFVSFVYFYNEGWVGYIVMDLIV